MRVFGCVSARRIPVGDFRMAENAVGLCPGALVVPAADGPVARPRVDQGVGDARAEAPAIALPGLQGGRYPRLPSVGEHGIARCKTMPAGSVCVCVLIVSAKRAVEEGGEAVE